MNLIEVKAAYDFGKSVVEEYVARGEQVPVWVVQRVLEMADQLISDSDIRIKQLIDEAACKYVSRKEALYAYSRLKDITYSKAEKILKKWEAQTKGYREPGNYDKFLWETLNLDVYELRLPFEEQLKIVEERKEYCEKDLKQYGIDLRVD